MIDPDGYRPNVGIILLREDGRVFWARRAFRDGWQFPQGGMRSDETPREAMYRELYEETGLRPQHVAVIGETPGWLKYRLPPFMVRRNQSPRCIGQKQVWFLLKFLGDDTALRLDVTDKPEFDLWRWVDFWYPANHVVSFKREVYRRALRHLAPYASEVSVAAFALADEIAEAARANVDAVAENMRVAAQTVADFAEELADAPFIGIR